MTEQICMAKGITLVTTVTADLLHVFPWEGKENDDNNVIRPETWPGSFFAVILSSESLKKTTNCVFFYKRQEKL